METLSISDTDNHILSVYLFGSFINTDYTLSNDIDLLLVYNSQDIYRDIEYIKNIKSTISKTVLLHFDLPVHFVTLSDIEFSLVKFFGLQKYIHLI